MEKTSEPEKNPKEYRKQYNYSERIQIYTQMMIRSGGFRLIKLLEQINKVDGIERISQIGQKYNKKNSYQDYLN